MVDKALKYRKAKEDKKKMTTIGILQIQYACALDLERDRESVDQKINWR